jgi:NAD(P)-dependent dehydrogenase (short-subunit alcohol dehydrogenase family)
MKTIFITGASTGLGKATAKLFHANGWKVIATMRKPENETELNLLENCVLLPLDVTSPEQIKLAAEQAITLGYIDVVFNNAGFGLGGPLEAYTDEQIAEQINTNLLGVIRVTQAFVPYFRARKSGLFLTTTSIGGLMAFPFYSVYSAAKWGVEGFFEGLSFELNKFGIGVKTISPGGINSAFRNSTSRAGHEAYNPFFNQMVNAFMTGKTPTIVSDPEQIAEVVYQAATDGKDQLRYHAGADAIKYVAMRNEQGPEAFRKGLDALFFGN